MMLTMSDEFVRVPHVHAAVKSTQAKVNVTPADSNRFGVDHN